jgi:multisubunit Na+/H+ antiporter MnhB subunit
MWELTPVTSAAQSANQNAQQAARSRPVKIGARVGILAYGITHLLIGWLALQIAFGQGGEQANQNGAFQTIADQPFGKFLLWVLVIGFIAAALWRAEQAIWGYSYVDDKKKQVRKKATSAGKAVLFLVLAVLAGRTAMGSGSQGGQQQQATAGVLGLPGGQFLVGLAGLIVIGIGVYKIVRGWKTKFTEDMDLPSDKKARNVAIRTGQAGYIGRGIATTIVGILVVLAAIRFDPAESAGLDAALKTLAQQPFGPYLLILVALGFICFGVFSFFDARYHRV